MQALEALFPLHNHIVSHHPPPPTPLPRHHHCSSLSSLSTDSPIEVDATILPVLIALLDDLGGIRAFMTTDWHDKEGRTGKQAADEKGGRQHPPTLWREREVGGAWLFPCVYPESSLGKELIRSGICWSFGW